MTKLLLLALITLNTTLAYSACSKGKVFNAKLGRCVLSTKTVENKSQALNCEGKSGDEFKECFHGNVSDELSEGKKAGKIGNSKAPDKKFLIPGIMTLASAIWFFKFKEQMGGCAETSWYLQSAAAVTTLLGEVLAQHTYKKSTKKLRDKYTSKMKDKPDEGESVIASISENQSLAFDFQIEQEEAREKAHKARKMVYMVGAGLYAASSIAAITESIFQNDISTCAGKTVVQQNALTIKTKYIAHLDYMNPYIHHDTLSIYELKEIILRKIYSIIIPTAHADNQGVIAGLAAAIGYPVILSMGKLSITRYLSVRAGFTGILANYSNNISSAAGDHADESKKRVKFLKELKSSFEENGGAGFNTCSEKQREDKKNPSCFCFAESGKKDEGKATLKVCVDFFATFAGVTGSDYGVTSASKSGGIKGCFHEDKKFDPSCKCKTQKSKKGKKANGCLKFSGKINLGALAKLAGTKPLIKDSLNFNRGNVSTADFQSTPGDIDRLINTINKKKKSLLKDKKFAPTLKKIAKLEKKMNRQLSAKIAKGLANGSITPPFSSGLGSSSNASSPQEILKDFKTKLNPSKFKKGNTLGGTKNSKSGDYDFGGGSKGGGIDFDEVDDVMKKEYSFNDINDNSDNNIFTIITNRYQRSGLRRLFDEKGVSKADGANETEINEK